MLLGPQSNTTAAQAAATSICDGQQQQRPLTSKDRHTNRQNLETEFKNKAKIMNILTVDKCGKVLGKGLFLGFSISEEKETIILSVHDKPGPLYT